MSNPNGRVRLGILASPHAVRSDFGQPSVGDETGNGADAAISQTSSGSESAKVKTPKIRKRELIAFVAARSGRDKGEVRPVIEAMLDVMGEGLAAGRDMDLSPLGKVRMERVKEKSDGRVISVRVRQKDPPATKSKEPLADRSE